MAKGRKKQTVNDPAEPKKELKSVSFTSWFVGALDRFSSLQPHHMNAVKSYCRSCGLGESAPFEEYDRALQRYGI